MSFKQYILAALGSVIVGLAMSLSVYLFMGFIIFLCIASLVLLILIVESLLKKTSFWKQALLFLSFGLIVVFTTQGTFTIRQNWDRNNRDKVVSFIYDYHRRDGKFPRSLQDLPRSLNSRKFNYVPDSSLSSFKIYHRDLFGFPHVFNSKDSVWD